MLSITNVLLYDFNGQELLNQKLLVGLNNIDVSFVNNGVYVMTIQSNQFTHSRKIIILNQ